jgi:hypothetical protein
MSNIREAAEGIQEQGADEELIYTITTTNWGTPTTGAPAIKSYDEFADADSTTTVFSSTSANVSGDVITLPALADLTVGHKYRIEVKFTDTDGNVWKPKFYVRCVE